MHVIRIGYYVLTVTIFLTISSTILNNDFNNDINKNIKYTYWAFKDFFYKKKNNFDSAF